MRYLFNQLKAMPSLIRHFKYGVLAFVTFLGGVIFYLVVPPFWVRIPDIPRKSPVALVTNRENQGHQCPASAYVHNEVTDNFDVINPYCAELQKELVKASSDGNIEQISSLLARGANPNARGLTSGGELFLPLPFAVRFGHNPDAVRLLLDNGGDVNAEYVCCATQASLLLSTVWNNDMPMAKLILSRKPDLNRTTFEGYTAFEVAQCTDKKGLLTLIDAAGGASFGQRLEYRAASLLRRKPSAMYLTLSNFIDPLGVNLGKKRCKFL